MKLEIWFFQKLEYCSKRSKHCSKHLSKRDLSQNLRLHTSKVVILIRLSFSAAI